MTCAFVIWLVDSFGEREHALRFAAGLGGLPGLEPVFIVPPSLAAHVAPLPTRVVAGDWGADASAVLAALAATSPRLVVCSEFYNLPPVLRVALAAAPWRLATFDGTSMGAAINGPDPIGLPAGTLVVRPCPINDPAPAGDGVFSWSLFRGLPRGDGGAARRALGIPAGDRLAFLAFAPWAVRTAVARGLARHYETLLGRLVDGCAAAGEETTLVVVAPGPPAAGGRSGVRVRRVPYLPRADYETILLGADLVISDNVIQTSLGKAFVAGIPTLPVVSSRDGGGDEPSYNIFPLALRLPAASAYLAAICPVDIGEPAAIAARIAAAWRGAPPSPSAVAYQATLAWLPEPAAIVAAAGIGAG